MSTQGRKVWNEDLILALETRANHAMTCDNISRYDFWRKEAMKVRSLAHDIYMFKNGRVVGLDKAKLARTAENECSLIMAGSKSIIPDDMLGDRPVDNLGIAPVSTVLQGSQNYRHPYLDKMQYKGGGYALLCAFRFHRQNRGFHYKNELIRDAQKYCDVAMEINYFAGRTQTAGWKSMESLVRHRLVNKRDMKAARAASGYAGNGWGGGGKDEFELSAEGEKFTDAMLEKWPIDNYSAQNTIARRLDQVQTFPFQDDEDIPNFDDIHFGETAINPTLAPIKANKYSDEDEQKLIRWLETAEKDDVLSFNVSKARRMYIHNYVQFLETNQGYSFQHQSMDKGRDRTLIVRLKSKPNGFQQHSGKSRIIHQPHNLKSPTKVATSALQMVTPHTYEYDRKGHRLGGSRSSNPREAVLAAAERRAEQNVKANMSTNANRKLITSIDTYVYDSDTDSHLEQNEIILDSLKNDENYNYKTNQLASVCDLNSNQCSDGSICIDSRERIKNSDPRQIINGIRSWFSRLNISSNISTMLRSDCVERLQLSMGDYAFQLASGNMASCLVERKSMNDIVGRSSNYCGVAHLKQLRMINSILSRGDSKGRAFLLLEGDLSQTKRALVTEREDDDTHVISNEDELYYLLCQLLVSKTSLNSIPQVIHTKDHECTFRQLCLLTYVVISCNRCIDPPMKISDFNKTFSVSRMKQNIENFTQELASALKLYSGNSDISLIVSNKIAERYYCWDALIEDYDMCSCFTTKEYLLQPVLMQEKILKENECLKWSSLLSSVVQNYQTKSKKRTTHPVSDVLPSLMTKRKVYVQGPLFDNMPPESFRNDTSIILGPCPHFRLTSPFVNWASVQVSCGSLKSCTYRVFLLPGQHVIDYIKSSFEQSSSMYTVAETAVNLLQDDIQECLKRTPSNSSISKTSDVIVIDGLNRECDRLMKLTNSSGIPRSLQTCLRATSELVSIMLQHSMNNLVINIHGNNVAEQLLRALVCVVRDEALLYDNVGIDVRVESNSKVSSKTSSQKSTEVISLLDDEGSICPSRKKPRVVDITDDDVITID